jgi:uncharacterized protein YjbI with pentapeptide repeats
MRNMDFKRFNASVREIANKRKEENDVFYKSHLKELTEERNISESFITLDTIGEGNDFFVLDSNEYKLARFTEINFGIDKASSEDEFIKVSNVCFYYCDFSMCGFNNISFSNCMFVGCKFTECYTLGLNALFTDCSFTSRIPDKRSIDDMPTSFSKCEFSVRFINCDISMTVLDQCNFYFSSFVNVNMNDAIFMDCSFDTTKFQDSDLRNTKIINARFIEFNIEDFSKKTKVNRKTFLGTINFNKKEEREVKYATEVYGLFSELFESNKLMDLCGEYFYQSRIAEMHNLKGYMKFKSIMGLLTCGFGERPSFSLFTSLFVILLCGTLYMLFGVSYNNENLIFHPTLGNMLPPLDKLVLWYHFSLVTFSTVGYGNVTPIGGSLAVSAVEMVTGVIMVGIWVSTLVRKMIR